jgi:hypothetical protein
MTPDEAECAVAEALGIEPHQVIVKDLTILVLARTEGSAEQLGTKLDFMLPVRGTLRVQQRATSEVRAVYAWSVEFTSAESVGGHLAKLALGAGVAAETAEKTLSEQLEHAGAKLDRPPMAETIDMAFRSAHGTHTKESITAALADLFDADPEQQVVIGNLEPPWDTGYLILSRKPTQLEMAAMRGILGHGGISVGEDQRDLVEQRWLVRFNPEFPEFDHQRQPGETDHDFFTRINNALADRNASKADPKADLWRCVHCERITIVLRDSERKGECECGAEWYPVCRIDVLGKALSVGEVAGEPLEGIWVRADDEPTTAKLSPPHETTRANLAPQPTVAVTQPTDTAWGDKTCVPPDERGPAPPDWHSWHSKGCGVDYRGCAPDCPSAVYEHTGKWPSPKTADSDIHGDGDEKGDGFDAALDGLREATEVLEEHFGTEPADNRILLERTVFAVGVHRKNVDPVSGLGPLRTTLFVRAGCAEPFQVDVGDGDVDDVLSLFGYGNPKKLRLRLILEKEPPF